MFVGRDSDSRATLVLASAEGRDRLVLSVASDGQASIQFLDENGNVVRDILP